MKLLATFTLISLLISNCCSAQSEHELTNLKYISRTRGGSKSITLNKQQVVFNLNGEEERYDVNISEWENLVSIVKAISLDDFETYTSAKKDRARDAAWHSTLSITVSGEEYESQTFDNQTAPKQLNALMQYLINLDQKKNNKENRLF